MTMYFSKATGQCWHLHPRLDGISGLGDKSSKCATGNAGQYKPCCWREGAHRFR